MELTASLAYYGLENDFISPGELLKHIENGEMQVDSSTLADLYIAAEESREAFISAFGKLPRMSEDDNLLSKRWALHFLTEIVNSTSTVDVKLREAASLWARFRYPAEWRGFIYYMPASEDEATGLEPLYQRLLNFIEAQKKTEYP